MGTMAHESNGAPLGLGDATSAATPQVRSRAAATSGSAEQAAQSLDGYSFGALAEHFLQHMAVARRCSPRTVDAYRSDYRKIHRLLSDTGHNLDVREIATGDLQVCIASLHHLSSASIERLIHSTSSFFGFLVKQGIVDRNPVDGLDRPRRSRKLPRQPSEEAFHRIVGACETLQEHLIVGLLGYSGLRRGEVLSLNVADVAADFSHVRVAGKGNKERVVPLHADLAAIARQHVGGLPPGDGSLIRNRRGNRMGETSLWRLFRRLVRRAGLEDESITPHCLRHHFASQLVRLGVDVVTVAELLGHSNISTTSIYLHSDSASKRAAISRLPSALLSHHAVQGGRPEPADSTWAPEAGGTDAGADRSDAHSADWPIAAYGGTPGERGGARRGVSISALGRQEATPDGRRRWE